nr:tyrosine-specific transport protein 2 [Quercus suber]
MLKLQLHLPHLSTSLTSIAYPRFNRHDSNFHHHRLRLCTQLLHTPPSYSSTLTPRTHNLILSHITSCTAHNANTVAEDFDVNFQHQKSQQVEQQEEGTHEKNFWGAVSLIIGTAVGPGMLSLPAATIKSGSFPSTIVILLSWLYVVSSIILVAELSFAAMEEDGVEEVSFTSLATKTLGSCFGIFVAIVYASLSFSLLVACVSGIGSLVSQWFPCMNLVMAHALFPLAVGTVILFFPFKAIDATNRFLCVIMLFSITALVAIGLSVARKDLLGSFGYASWGFSSILPAIPITVLTLGFHVVTPFICKIAGNTVKEARKAILVGGAVPLVMVLSWNLIVLGLAGTNRADPISLLLSVNPSALPAVQGFAFTALATSLIGYAMGSNADGIGRVGIVVYSGRPNLGNVGKVSYIGSGCIAASEAKLKPSMIGFDSFKIFEMIIVLVAPVLIASFFRSTFTRALDFAGVYANCFLFGILPPAMAYIQRSRKKLRSSILLGGDGTLLLLFSIAVILGIWH